MYEAKFFQPTSNANEGEETISLSGIVVAIKDITFFILENRVASAAWFAPFGNFFAQKRKGIGKLSVTTHHALQAASHE
jgi:hypothetical protein